MTHQRRILIGFSLALLVVLTVGCSFALALIEVLRPHTQWVVMGFAVLGIALLVLGRCVAGAANQDPAMARTHSGSHEAHPLFFFKRVDYWGWILVLAALPIFFLSQRLGRPVAVAARTLPKPKVAAEAPAPAPAPAPVVVTKFPDLRLKGLVCNGTRSTAVVNGQTVGLGQRVEGVRVVAIERWGITVEMEGRERNVTLPQ